MTRPFYNIPLLAGFTSENCDKNKPMIHEHFLQDLETLSKTSIMKRKEAWKFIETMQHWVPHLIKELKYLRKKRETVYSDERLRSIMQTATPQSVVGQLIAEIKRLSKD